MTVQDECDNILRKLREAGDWVSNPQLCQMLNALRATTLKRLQLLEDSGQVESKLLTNKTRYPTFLYRIKTAKASPNRSVFDFESGEPVKLCKFCGLEKRLDLMVKQDGYKDGYRPMCLDCKNKAQIKQREERRSRMVKQVQLEQSVKYATPSLTPGRTFVPTGHYVPEKTTYYRNDGNKHIQSKGFRT